MKINFVGAGSGAVDLITVRGKSLIEQADVIVYAGSLVNPELLTYAKQGCDIYNSATMTLEEVMDVMITTYKDGKSVVRLHTGDPSVYGAIREQMDILDEQGIEYEVCPGVSACFGAAASLGLEYTLPGISQTLIVTRTEGRTPVPKLEGIVNLAKHQASMAIYLSAGLLEQLQSELLAGGYEKDVPAAIVYKATWTEEKIIYCTVGNLAEAGKKYDIKSTALILVGEAVGTTAGYKQNHGETVGYDRSKLYSPDFTTGFRKGTDQEDD